MKQSRKSRRMQRHYKRMHRPGGLNLVSMMDIFTILVFFLMLNSSDVKVIQQSTDIHLPQSTAHKTPDETLTIQVTEKHIVVQGREVAGVAGLPETGDIPGLREELNHQRSRRTSPVPPNGMPVTIMADRGIPYSVLRQIIRTCVDADYRQVKLAVNRKEAHADG